MNYLKVIQGKYGFLLAVLLIVIVAGVVIVSNISPTGYQVGVQQTVTRSYSSTTGTLQVVFNLDQEYTNVVKIDFEGTPKGTFCGAAVKLEAYNAAGTKVGEAQTGRVSSGITASTTLSLVNKNVKKVIGKPAADSNTNTPECTKLKYFKATLTFQVLPDTTSPTIISVTQSPLDPKIGDTVTITATASDNKKVSSLKIIVDNNEVTGTCTGIGGTSASCTFSASSLSVGSHTFYAKALDPSENFAQIKQQEFNVKEIRYTVTINKVGPASGTMTSTPAGINCGDICSATFVKGTNIMINPPSSADMTPGTTFVGWSGAGCSGAGTCYPPTLEADTEITATFSGDTTPPTVTISGPTEQDFGMTIGITISAQDTMSDISSVKLFIGTTEVTPICQNVNNNPKQKSCTYQRQTGSSPLEPGTHTYYAKATDSRGNEGTSNSITIVVHPYGYVHTP